MLVDHFNVLIHNNITDSNQQYALTTFLGMLVDHSMLHCFTATTKSFDVHGCSQSLALYEPS
jgi:hypothetical protein